MTHPFGMSTAAIALGAALLVSAPLNAQDLPSVKFSVITGPSMINAYKLHHEPFFKTTITQDSGGKIVADFKPNDLLGLNNQQVTRMNTSGVVDIAYSAYNYLAGDDPRLEGIDLPGIGLSVDEYRKAAESYLPVVSKVLAEKHKLHMLFTNAITMQVIFCKGKTTELADLKGRKVRVFSPAQADYLKAAGAVAVNMPFEEVLPALQQGVIECAITSTTNGNTARWWEVVTDILVLPMGWGANFFGANVDFWKKLDLKVQAFLNTEFPKLNDGLWKQAASDLQDGINCNTGQGECKQGIKPPQNRLLKVSYPSAADKTLHAKIMQETVLKKWAERCGAECVTQWNATMGKAVGMTASM